MSQLEAICESFAIDSLVERLGWVLVHSLWQFALVAAAAFACLRLLSRSTAEARYLTLQVAMALVMLLPFATWLIVPSEPPAARVAALTPVAAEDDGGDVSVEVEPPLTEGIVCKATAVTTGQSDTAENVCKSPPEASVAENDTATLTATSKLSLPMAQIVGLWCLGVVAFSLRPLLGWYTLCRLRRRASPVPREIQELVNNITRRMQLRRGVEVLQSTLVNLPMTFGYFSPCVLLPISIVSGLPASQLEAIIAHELAHICRRDYLVNLLQTILETAFFYHPATWWLSSRLRVEREYCCDDLAAEALGNGVELGRALLSLEEMRGLRTVLALGTCDGSLVKRVRRLCCGEPLGRGLGVSGIVACSSLLISVAIAVAVWAGAGPGSPSDDTLQSSRKTTAFSNNETTAEEQTRKKTFSLSKVWKQKDLRHQQEAQGIAVHDGSAYLGTYGADGQIVKVRIKDGAVAWSRPTGDSYQPSYPASNGDAVVYGTFSGVQIVGLDDRTGRKLWSVPTDGQNSSAAAFVDKLAIIGSNDKHVYGIKWETGEVIWKSRLGNGIRSRPAVFEKDVLVGCYDGNVYRIKAATGEVIKKTDCGGRIASNPLVVGKLLFVLADDLRFGEEFDGTKVRRRCVVIDLAKNKIVSSIRSDRTLQNKFVVADDRVYFFSHQTLYAYDGTTRSLAWKYEEDLGELVPCPLVHGDVLLLPFNQIGKEGQNMGNVVALSASMGQVIDQQTTSGLGWYTACVQAGGFVFTSDLGGSAAYRIVSKPAVQPGRKTAVRIGDRNAANETDSEQATSQANGTRPSERDEAESRKLANQLLVAAGKLDVTDEIPFVGLISPLHQGPAQGFARVSIHEPSDQFLDTLDGKRLPLPGERKRAYYMLWNAESRKLLIDPVPLRRPRTGYAKNPIPDGWIPCLRSANVEEFRWRKDTDTGEVTVEPQIARGGKQSQRDNGVDVTAAADGSVIEIPLAQGVGLRLMPLDAKAGTLVSVTPVTNAQYALAVQEKALPAPTVPRFEHERWFPHPPKGWQDRLIWNGRNPPADQADAAVPFLSLDEAHRYCRWLNKKSSKYQFRVLNPLEWLQMVGLVSDQNEVAAKFHPFDSGAYYAPRPAAGARSIRTDLGVRLAPQTVNLLSAEIKPEFPVERKRDLQLQAGVVSDNGRPSTARIQQGRYATTTRGYSRLLLPTTFHVVATGT